MLPLSCTNCAHNPLQHDAVGTSVGFCTVHRRVLNTPGELTCGQHFRKDLTLLSAKRQRDLHLMRFGAGTVSSLATRKPVNGAHTSTARADLSPLEADAVAAAVTDYGRLGSKIESLAQLSAMPGARADIALASLGRAYVDRCVERGGSWTSGLHLFWWVKARVAIEPDVRVDDLRTSSALPLGRQMDLARWSILMLRLAFLSDVGAHARSTHDRVRRAGNLVERAAEATGQLSFSRLMKWVRSEGKKQIDDALPVAEYERRSLELHRDEV